MIDQIYVDLKNQKYTNIAYHFVGLDPHLHKNHSHEGCEIIQTMCDGGYIFANGKIYPMAAGGIYFINCIESHSTNPTNEKKYIRNKVTFSPFYIRSVLDIMEPPYIMDFLLSGENLSSSMYVPSQYIIDEINSLFFKMQIEEKRDKNGSNSYITSCIIELLFLIYKHCHEQSDKAAIDNMFNINNVHIPLIIDYLKQHLQDDINIDKMCLELHLSKYYMCHIFKKVTGMTIMKYVTEQRVSEAKKLLRLTSNPVSDIAMLTGFSSFSHFCRTFKNVTGITPLEYRH